MIDELSLGLAPTLIENLSEVVRQIHEHGTTVLLVEQSLDLARRLAARAVFMERGRILFSGATSELVDRDDLVRAVFLADAAKDAGDHERASRRRPEPASPAGTVERRRSCAFGAGHAAHVRRYHRRRRRRPRTPRG